MVQFPRTSYCFRRKTCDNSIIKSNSNQTQYIKNSEKNYEQGMYTFNEINDALHKIYKYIENDYFSSEIYKIASAVESIILSSSISETRKILTTDELIENLEEIYNEFNEELKQIKYNFQF